MEKPAIDSPEAMKRAKAAKPAIEPLTSDGRGFHFGLESSTITVRASFRHSPAIVSLDSATGQIVSAQRFTEGGSGGVLYSSDGGQTWAARDLKGRLVIDVYSDPLKEEQAYAAVIEDDTIHLYYQTRDGGKTWTQVSDLPADAGNWAFSLRAVAEPSGDILLLVGTWSGLWVSRGGKGWSRASGLPEGPKQWQGVVQSNQGYRVFVSITFGPDRGLYASSDLSTWSRETAIPYRLSESYDRQAVLATDEWQRSALLLNARGRKVIALPEALSERMLDGAGAFDGSAPMLLRGGGGIGRHFKQSVTQTELGAATLAVPRDFPASQVVIAGGFRTGIYRSMDGAQTWHLVLSDPSALIAGRGEIWAVEFLSAKSVIAVNGGYSQWKEF